MQTLRVLPSRVVMPATQWEVIVVDNASTDGTADAVAQFASTVDVSLIRRPRNEGVSARNYAIARVRGTYLLLVDDDAEPLGTTVQDSLGYMESHERCAAVGGRVALLDGSLEASALPAVPIHCGVVMRTQAVREVGGLPVDFYRQAEEYDLALRLWQAGWTVDRFEDLTYRHYKQPGARPEALRWDARNNMILAARYLPPRLARVYTQDWTQRYLLMARHAGRGMSARLGLIQGRYATTGYDAPTPMGPAALDAVFGFQRFADQVAAWAEQHGVRRVGLAGLAKNIFAPLRACRVNGLDVVGVLDDHPAFTGARYRGLPVVSEAHAMVRPLDALVVAEQNPARVDAVCDRLKRQTGLPLLRLWEPRLIAGDREALAMEPLIAA